MKYLLLPALLLLAACGGKSYDEQSYPAYKTEAQASNAASITQAAVAGGYWRPISSPNIQLPADAAQGKLEFDLSQCKCANFPKNVPTPIMMVYQPDQARMVETSRQGSCATASSGTVMTECMRSRGWEPTLCAGRLPTETTGAFCGG